MELENYESDTFQVDVSKFPFVRMASSSIQPTSQQVDSYLEYLDKLHLHSDSFVIMSETPKKMIILKAEHRIKIGNWMKENKEKIINCKAMAFIASSVLYKVILQGIFLIQPPLNEYKVFKSEKEATEWLHQKMKENNISFSSSSDLLDN